MSIFGIGPLELIAILVIALLILGPKDIAKMSRTIGKWLRTIVQSETWRIIRGAANEIRNIPNRLMRESGLENLNLPTEKEINDLMGVEQINKEISGINADLSDWTSQTNTIAPPDKLTPKPQKTNPPPQKAQTSAKKETPSETDWTSPRVRKRPNEPVAEGETSPVEEIQTPSPTFPPPTPPEDKTESAP
jgi:sec-independent protein translocase protein TatB